MTEEEKIIKLYNAGKSMRTVASELGISRSKVERAIKKLGNARTKKSFDITAEELLVLVNEQKMSDSQIGKIYGVSASAVRKRRDKYGIKAYSSVEAMRAMNDQELLDMRTQYSIADMAAMLHVGKILLREELEKRGLSNIKQERYVDRGSCLIEEEDLRQEYVDEEMTIESIAKKHGVSSSVVMRHLRLYEIPFVNHKKRVYERAQRDLPEPLLRELYLVQCKTKSEIASRYGYSTKVINYLFGLYGIENHEPNQNRKAVLRLSYDDLIDQYQNKMRSLEYIANKFSIEYEEAKSICLRFDIPLRREDMGESPQIEFSYEASVDGSDIERLVELAKNADCSIDYVIEHYDKAMNESSQLNLLAQLYSYESNNASEQAASDDDVASMPENTDRLLSCDDLHELLVLDCRSYSNIAQEYDIGVKHLRKWAKEDGVTSSRERMRYLNEEVLNNLIHDEGKTACEISAEFGLHLDIIQEKIEKWNIVSLVQECDISAELLSSMFCDQYKTKQEVATQLGKTISEIEQLIERYDISLARPSLSSLTLSAFTRWYRVEKQSLAAIARRLECSEAELASYMRQMNIIPILDFEESEVVRKIANGANNADLAFLYDKTIDFIDELRHSHSINTRRASALTKERLQALLDDGQSPKVIAAKYGCSVQLVYKCIYKWNLRSVYHVDIDESLVIESYENGKSISGISDEHNVSFSTIRKIIEQAGLSIRKDNEPININKDILSFLYSSRKMSTYELAEYFRCSRQTIRKKMLQYGIEARQNVGRGAKEIQLEAEIRQLVSFEVKHSERILDGKEIDIYIPAIALGVEVSPTATHNSTCSVKTGRSADAKPNNYHKNKSELAKGKGVRLMHVFDWVPRERVIDFVAKYSPVNEISNKMLAGSRVIRYNGLSKHAFEHYMNDERHINAQRIKTYSVRDDTDNELISLELTMKEQSNWLASNLYLSHISAISALPKLISAFVEDHGPASLSLELPYAEYLDTDVLEPLRKSGFATHHIVEPRLIWSDRDHGISYLDENLSPDDYEANFGVEYARSDDGSMDVDEMKARMADAGYYSMYDAGLDVYQMTR